MEETDGERWSPTGARTIRARSETNRITTLTKESLEEAALEDGVDMAIFARPDEIRLAPWEDGIPDGVCLPDKQGERGIFYPCGVREIHTSGTSTVITLTERALETAGFDEGTKLQQRAEERGLKLEREGPDVEVA